MTKTTMIKAITQALEDELKKEKNKLRKFRKIFDNCLTI